MEIKLFTSYFYQIRNFKPYMIPLSTAKYQPKWFTENGKTYLDKNNVINGLVLKDLQPLSDNCRGRERCESSPFNCLFLKDYKDQLNKINSEEFIHSLSKLEKDLSELLNISHEIYFIFMFYETPSNPCSERVPFQEWVRTNLNLEINEIYFK